MMLQKPATILHQKDLKNYFCQHQKTNRLYNDPYKMSQFPSLPQTNNCQQLFHLKNQISDDWRVQLKPTLGPGCFYHGGIGGFYYPES